MPKKSYLIFPMLSLLAFILIFPRTSASQANQTEKSQPNSPAQKTATKATDQAQNQTGSKTSHPTGGSTNTATTSKGKSGAQPSKKTQMKPTEDIKEGSKTIGAGAAEGSKDLGKGSADFGKKISKGNVVGAGQSMGKGAGEFEVRFRNPQSSTFPIGTGHPC